MFNVFFNQSKIFDRSNMSYCLTDILKLKIKLKKNTISNVLSLVTNKYYLNIVSLKHNVLTPCTF